MMSYIRYLQSKYMIFNILKDVICTPFVTIYCSTSPLTTEYSIAITSFTNPLSFLFLIPLYLLFCKRVYKFLPLNLSSPADFKYNPLLFFILSYCINKISSCTKFPVFIFLRQSKIISDNLFFSSLINFEIKYFNAISNSR